MKNLCNKIQLNAVLALIYFFDLLCTLVLLLLIKYCFHALMCLVCHVLKAGENLVMYSIKTD